VRNNHSTPTDAVVAFLRSELERRYRYGNVRRFSELKDIAPGILADFREFALNRVYPDGEARAELDAAFAGLQELLRSPRKMASLGSVVLSAVLRLGRKLPAALSAGQQVIQAFSCASTVEAALSEAVVEHNIPWKGGLDTDEMKVVFAELPAEPFDALISALVHLLELAGNRDTLQTGLGLLEKIAGTMSRKPEQWTDADQRGIALATEALTEAIALFSHIDDRDASRFIVGIEAVETDWYQTLRAGK
jgi:hypothetical protein